MWVTFGNSCWEEHLPLDATIDDVKGIVAAYSGTRRHQLKAFHGGAPLDYACLVHSLTGGNPNAALQVYLHVFTRSIGSGLTLSPR